MENLTAAEAERETYIHNVEETLSRIASHKGVVGYFVIHPVSGKILKYEGFGDDAKSARRHADTLKGFIEVAASTIRTLDWRDTMTFLRMSCGDLDIMVAPDAEKHYTLVVVQHARQ